MRFWIFFKLLAGLAVVAVMGFTGMLAYHVGVRPLGGVFERIIPNPTEVLGVPDDDAEFARMLDAAEMPDIEPGEKVFQKAHELIALGQLEEAREKLMTIVNVYPTSGSAAKARRIVGDMNLDEILSPGWMEGKRMHVVKPGESYFGIVARHETSLDLVMHLNGMMELSRLQPGDELVVMPLNFRILIDRGRQTVSLWDGGRFIREYPVAHFAGGGVLHATRTQVASKAGMIDGKRVAAESKEYRGAEKSLQLAAPPIQIRPLKETDAAMPRGIYLSPPDMEELALLTRVGNEVEIR
jgi:hypothetical protein